ncbi:alkaline phosphatase D family protein [Nocardioides sambongensis]|uniref:alkaline phosphatase D family protein n=1 Tax=Nocardioides sambongensis TaxID=2589074 RepID=UPI0018C89A4E|nr:alkaline phosphatase D family protein [Nocardioides sambongensis]
MVLLGATRQTVLDLHLRRRATIVGGLATGAIPLAARLGPALLPQRSEPTEGVRTGEVTTSSAVVWARAARPGRMMVRVVSGCRRGLVRGPIARTETDLTARVHLQGLRPGRDHRIEVWFAQPDGERSVPMPASFRTAPIHTAGQSLVWSGDTCGQGWGIDRARGGLTTYAAMHRLRPDLFVHLGDTIYADEPIEESVRLDDGSTWHNHVTAEVSRVAQSLDDFRGRHRYPLADDNVRAFYADVPTMAMWDDHETCNNWWPGETITDDRYTERRADVLAVRGRRAWQEYQPVPVRQLVPADGDGFAPTRIHRRVPRGQHLDLFCLDMRSWRGPNPDTDPAIAADRTPAGILGRRQEEWLIRSLRDSTATWKVVCADMPLSTPTSRTTDLDTVANTDHGAPMGREPEIGRILAAIRRHRVRNVVWLTADVHYTAAHHYSPERAAFTDFDPFWEFVSGPVAASPFWTKDADLDRTFGPEVVFSQGESEVGKLDTAPRPENQYFGQLEIAADGLLTVTLRDGAGTALWRRGLEPDPVLS